MVDINNEPVTEYVLGFAIDSSSNVLLIKKKRGPSFNIGMYNGIGGSIEDRETRQEAMAREFQEECGLSTPPENWECFHVKSTRLGLGQGKYKDPARVEKETP